MIQITPQMRILVAIKPADFRSYAVREVMRSSVARRCSGPRSGTRGSWHNVEPV